MNREISRRGFLKVAATALTSLGSDVSAQTNTRSPLITLFLSGAPGAKETWNPDPPSSPSNLRGSLGTVQTRTSGVHFSEVWPQLASRSDKFSVLRAIDAGSSDHTPGMQTAVLDGSKTISERIGEQVTTNMPYILLHAGRTWHGLRDAFRSNHAFVPTWDSQTQKFKRPEMAPMTNLEERRRMLETFDQAPDTPTTRRMQIFRESAFDLINGGGRFFEALDLPERDRERYGKNLSGDMVLTAKRFIERGAGSVTVYDEPGAVGWDFHTQIGNNMKAVAPDVDKAAAALIDEISSGQLNAILLIMGEINRTPAINSGGGRDHAREGNVAILAGGGIRSGVVHGRTSIRGEIIDGRVRQQDIASTLFAASGGELSPAAARVRAVL